MSRVGLVAALTATALTLSTTQALAEPSPITGIETNTAQRNGYIEHLENLGLSSSNTSLYDFIVNSWAGSEERGIIAAHNGHRAQGGGHYFVLIHPKRTAFGFDSFGDFGSSNGGGIMGILAGLVSLISLLGFIAQFAVKFLPRLPR